MEFVHKFGVAGTPLATDTAPNTTAPLESRRFRAPRFTGAVCPNGVEMYVASITGTSCTVQLWSWNEEIKRWFTIGGTVVVAADACVAGFKAKPGALLFLQVTANIGVERVGAGFLAQAENKRDA